MLDSSKGDRVPLLSVHNLSTTFSSELGPVSAVRDVSWQVYPGEVLGVVGESGSGKSMMMASILGLLPASATLTGGPIMFGGQDLLALPERQMRAIRGAEISMIFQDPMTSFIPVRTIGQQISEAIRVHDRTVSRRMAKSRSIELLKAVGVPSAAVRFSQYPHEYSGGMRQRAMIAMAIANRPKLIIADEPTTALDVTIQAQILDLLALIRNETDAAMILITHDLGLIAETSDRVLVMYAGKVVETAPVRALFSEPRHPYTIGLLDSLPRIDVEVERLRSIPGHPPSMVSPPPGCAFHPRCQLSRGRSECFDFLPELVRVGKEHATACHFFRELHPDADRLTSSEL